MNIKIVRLTTGEDLLADVSEAMDGSSITLENPCMLYMRPNDAGTATVGMTRWLPYSSDKTFVIPRSFVITACEPADDLRNQYNSVFGSGLVVPPQKIVTGA